MTDDLVTRQAIRTLSDLRKHHGLTIAQVAEAVGVDKSVISRFENQTTDPHVSTLMRYARAVGANLQIHIEPMVPVELDTRVLREIGRRVHAKFPEGLTLDPSKATGKPPAQ